MITFSTSIILYGVCQFIYHQNLTNIAYNLGISEEIEAGFTEFITGVRKALFLYLTTPKVTAMANWYNIANSGYFAISLKPSLLFIESLITYGINDITIWFKKGDKFFSSSERKLLSSTKSPKKIVKLICSITCKSSFDILCTATCEKAENIAENLLEGSISFPVYEINTHIYQFMRRSFTVGTRKILLENIIFGKDSIIPQIYYALARAYHEMQDVTQQNKNSPQKKDNEIQAPKTYLDNNIQGICIKIELFDDKSELFIQERENFFCNETDTCPNEDNSDLVLLGKLFDIPYSI